MFKTASSCGRKALYWTRTRSLIIPSLLCCPWSGPRVDKRLMRQEYEYMESLLPALGLYGHVELVSEIIDQLRVSRWHAGWAPAN
jgi:hypothetical protein